MSTFSTPPVSVIARRRHTGKGIRKAGDPARSILQAGGEVTGAVAWHMSSAHR
jgi:hypothetical protein